MGDVCVNHSFGVAFKCVVVRLKASLCVVFLLLALFSFYSLRITLNSIHAIRKYTELSCVIFISVVVGWRYLRCAPRSLTRGSRGGLIGVFYLVGKCLIV